MRRRIPRQASFDPLWQDYARALVRIVKHVAKTFVVRNDAADWSEAEHPRDEAGRFSNAGSAVRVPDHHFEEMKRSAISKMSAAEVQASYRYTGSAFRAINKNLRDGAEQTARDTVAIKDLDGIMARAIIDRDVLVYRGASNDFTFQKKVGDSYTDLGFVSTSVDPSRAFVKETTLVITLPRGTRAEAIPSDATSEKEVLIDRGTKFVITKIEYAPGATRPTVHVTAVQSPKVASQRLDARRSRRSLAADDRFVETGDGLTWEILRTDAKKISLDQKDLKKLTTGYAKRTADFNAIQLERQGLALPKSAPSMDDKIADFAAENASKIQGLADDMLAELQLTVVEGVKAHKSQSTIAEDIAERVGVAESWAISLARNQVGSLYGQINAARQQALGIRRFVWRSMGDDRVRDEHADREKQSEKTPFSYDDPPDGELPGEPYGCRCHAEPAFSDDTH